MPDPILSQLQAKTWGYADGDPSALATLGERIAATGKERQLIHYSDLVRGVTVRLPNVENGTPFELGVPDWRDLDRSILGSFLGRLCVDSYRRGAFLASALVTSKGTDEPSEGFWTLVDELGMLRSRAADKRLLFWIDEVRKAHNWYQANHW